MQMTESYFFRVLTSSIENKGKDLKSAIAGVNSGKIANIVFRVDISEFSEFPNSPFAYWLSNSIRKNLQSYSTLEPTVAEVRVGLQTGDDPQFVRAIWEVDPADLYFCYYPTDGSNFVRFDDPIVQSFFVRRDRGKMKWAFHVKAGASQPWYSPLTVVVDWENDGEALRNFRDEKGKLRSRPQNLDFYFRPGFSWTRRAVRLVPYVVPCNTIPTVSRYMAFPENGLEFTTVAYCASNVATGFSRIYGEKFEWPNFLVETIKSLPWSDELNSIEDNFNKLVSQEVKERRNIYSYIEPFQDFCFPAWIREEQPNLSVTNFNLFSLLGRDLDIKVAQIFGFSETELSEIERDMVEAIEFQATHRPENHEEEVDNEQEGDEVESRSVIDVSEEIKAGSLIQYAIGCSLGRWDIRIAANPELAPKPAGPFEPLPACPPGTLVGPDGLPAKSGTIVSEHWLRSRPNAITLPESSYASETIPDSDYPLSIAWDGVLVDDPNHPHDMVANVRRVIQLLWEDEADDIETEACQILGVDNLREYFRDPNNGFFDFHIKRYSKSRRKAPIYWLLQSSQRNYAIWLYYHRLTPDTLFHAAREYVDPKLNLETSRLEELQSGLEALSGSQRTRRERQIADQASLVDEIKAFQKELDRVALLELKPDLNDGVILNIAPLHQLVPWKEAGKYWGQLTRGKYEWSSIAQQMRQRGIVKGRS
jgi:hypothetical protein